MSLRQNQVGDTIVEAMIAVMVITITIAGAYGVASRSLKAARQAQERGEALKLAEGQLETIKGITSGAVDAPGVDLSETDEVFCLNGVTKHDFGIGWGSTIKPVETDNLDDYPAGCVAPSGGLYHIATQVQQLDTNRYQYTVTVRWFRIGTNAKDEVRMDYRLFLEAN
ncbi:hypothetical protein KA047_03675 [Candidatus Saccharibacteria bacterium]|nr:hypothetical protein [Candidatus Saccharibacteria bacterium]